MANIQNFRADIPIADPETGLITPEFLRFLFDKDNNLVDIDGGIANKANKTTNLTAGNGLTGGGTLEADRTFNVGAGTGIQVNTDDVALNAGIDLLTDVDTSTTAPTDGQALVWEAASSLWKPGDVATSGGGGGSVEFIDEVVATGGETSLSVTGISQDYKDLIVVFELNGTANGICTITLNADSTANYDYDRHYGGASHNDGNYTNQTGFGNLITVTADASRFVHAEMQFIGYSDTDRYTGMLSKARYQSGSSEYVLDGAGEFTKTDAITSVEVAPPSGSFNSGSRVRVYGRNNTTPSGGGSSEWTRLVLSSDFSTSSASQQAVTGLEFTPSAGVDYEVEGTFLVSSASSTIGARHGVIWPTGGTVVHATGELRGWNSHTSETIRGADSGTLTVCHTTGVNGVNEIAIARMRLRVKYSAAPSTALQASLNAEGGGATVTMHAGSELSYREIS